MKTKPGLFHDDSLYGRQVSLTAYSALTNRPGQGVHNLLRLLYWSGVTLSHGNTGNNVGENGDSLWTELSELMIFIYAIGLVDVKHSMHVDSNAL